MNRSSAILLYAMLLPVPARADDFGKFDGNPQTEWNVDGRTMRLLKNFTYEDPKGDKWVAPAGSTVDGASIPRMFWALIGGPFEGEYRNASIVHDTECTEPYKHDWRAVHRMFYFACRAGGSRLVKAKIMFAAVYHFGPRWAWPPPNRTTPEGSAVQSQDDALRMIVVVRKNPEISLDAIEGLSHVALVDQVTDRELETQREMLLDSQRMRLQGDLRGPLDFE